MSISQAPPHNPVPSYSTPRSYIFEPCNHPWRSVSGKTPHGDSLKNRLPEKTQLRLVCRLFNSVATPAIWCCLNLRIDGHKTGRLHKLYMLMNGDNRIMASDTPAADPVSQIIAASLRTICSLQLRVDGSSAQPQADSRNMLITSLIRRMPNLRALTLLPAMSTPFRAMPFILATSSVAPLEFLALDRVADDSWAAMTEEWDASNLRSLAIGRVKNPDFFIGFGNKVPKNLRSLVLGPSVEEAFLGWRRSRSSTFFPLSIPDDEFAIACEELMNLKNLSIIWCSVDYRPALALPNLQILMLVRCRKFEEPAFERLESTSLINFLLTDTVVSSAHAEAVLRKNRGIHGLALCCMQMEVSFASATPSPS